MPFISFPILLIAIVHSPNVTQATRYGFIFGLGWFSFGLSWVHNAIADFGGLPLFFSLLLMLLLVAYLALFPALFSWLTFKTKDKYSLFVVIPLWLSVEYLRSVLLTGFPWLSIGYSQLTSSLSGYAPIVGELGLQAIVILLSCLIVIAFNMHTTKTKDNYKYKTVSIVALFLIPLAGQSLTYYQWSEDNKKQINLALVQGNIAQSIKWQPENEVPTMVKYYELTSPHWQSADIVIWPEAAIPRLEISSNDFLSDMDKDASESNTALITGIVDYQPNTTYAFNNIVTLGKKIQPTPLAIINIYTTIVTVNITFYLLANLFLLKVSLGN
ncbi:apolipoprotein N-acyltransferase [Psychrosphaera aquimarina]|uniref:Apolipoprotein N-acyltransferase n=1 Tax=Psychrosphaera aquimarina TaxID=2044854 RepID=A0ABU3QVR9_9GAMM|nr:apolipoprotein N-acyltransferase [Psychrosphaera aquimarina]MDU0111534.1 apolipoprotein N-acyltransferase [Psychrosphaera aquimarina]